MKHADFTIGMAFETSTGQRWRCTDVSRRTITAIELAPDLDLAWFNGPPYSVSEVVFDEVDIARAFRSQEEAIRDALAEAKNAVHPGYPHEVVDRMMKARFPEEARRYPHPRLLRVDRVDADGEILHPYAAEATHDGWQILLYAPFTETFSALPESDFLRLRSASRDDLLARKHR
ncbi:hypothetical protein [uncultured Luteimonas sp.]|uniref:hypothetical protein n=1 Tax=uncultured Luteimonas sp. TaxID=453144 RepID=UPI00262AC397|nr:hypothetical protein [uncultured Luteimonas sp.]